MASPQLDVQVFEPKDFKITWGEDKNFWRLPTEENPTAELIRVNLLMVEFTAHVSTAKPVTVAFDVSKTAEPFGWEESEVRIAAINGGHWNWKGVKSQLNLMEPNERKEIVVSFKLYPSSSNVLTIHFSDSKNLLQKGGLIFYGAKVIQESTQEN